MFATLWSVLIALGLATPQQMVPPFPRPGAMKVFENERVILWEVKWKKGLETGMHRHAYDLVAVDLSDAEVRIINPDATTRVSAVKPGAVIFQEKGVTHNEAGASDVERWAVIAELKDFKQPPLTDMPKNMPLAFPRDGAKKLIDNPRVTVWEYQFMPGKPIANHFHDKDTVIVWTEAGKMSSTPVGGEEQITPVTYGESRFAARNRAHSEAAAGGSPKAIIIELK